MVNGDYSNFSVVDRNLETVQETNESIQKSKKIKLTQFSKGNIDKIRVAVNMKNISAVEEKESVVVQENMPVEEIKKEYAVVTFIILKSLSS